MPPLPGLVWWHWKHLFLCNCLGPGSSRTHLRLWHCMQTHAHTSRIIPAPCRTYIPGPLTTCFCVITRFKLPVTWLSKALCSWVLLAVFLISFRVIKAICSDAPEATAGQLKFGVLIITLKDSVNFITPTARRLLLRQNGQTDTNKWTEGNTHIDRWLQSLGVHSACLWFQY